MTRLEDDLRDAYRRNTPTNGELHEVNWAPTAGGGHVRPAWLLPVLAAASVALVVLGVGALARGALDLNSQSTATPATGPLPAVTVDPLQTSESSSPRPTPSVSVFGTRTEEYRGIRITVPSTLEANAWNCGQQSAPTVIIGPLPTGCTQPFRVISDVALIRVLPSESTGGRELVADATHPVTVDGVEAFTSCKRCSSEDIANGTYSTNEVGTLYFPEQKVVIDAYTGNAAGGADEIFRTVRVD